MKSIPLVVLLFICTAQAVYFYLEPKKPFCIIEKPVDNQPIVFKYRNFDLFMYKPDYDGDNDLNSKIYVISPKGTKFMETNAKESGKFIFTPYESGSYSICVELSRTLPDEFWEYGNPLRFYFETEHGIKKMESNKLAKFEDIDKVDKSIGSLVRVLKEMTQEMESQNEKEKVIRDEDDSDNKMIIIWSSIEACLMILVAIIQVSSIRKYLKKKQIIL